MDDGMARGDRLFFTQVDYVMEVEVSGTAAPVLGTPKRLFTRPALGQGRSVFTRRSR